MTITKGASVDCNTGEGYLYEHLQSDEQFWDVSVSIYNQLHLQSQTPGGLTLMLSPSEAVGLVVAIKRALRTI